MSDASDWEFALHPGDRPTGWPIPGRLSTALSTAVTYLEGGNSRYAAALRCASVDEQAAAPESVLIVRRDDPSVLVLGQSFLAHQARALFTNPEGLAGRLVHELPTSTRPLNSIENRISAMVCRALARRGFISVEEVLAVPVTAWADVMGIGTKHERRLCDALESMAAESEDPPDLLADERRRAFAAHLAPIQQVRNAAFLDVLAASSVPASTAEQVCRLLDLEPVPRANVDVSRLLSRTGMDPAPLHFYLSTHGSNRRRKS